MKTRIAKPFALRRLPSSGVQLAGCRNMPGNKIIALLRGGNRRSIGRADKVAAMAAKKPVLFQQLIAGLWDEHAVVRMRSADAAEKVTRKNYGLLASYRKGLLSLLAEAGGQEVRWHLAVMVPRLPLSNAERKQAVSQFVAGIFGRSQLNCQNLCAAGASGSGGR